MADRDELKKKGAVISALVDETPRGTGAIGQAKEMLATSDDRIQKIQQIALLRALNRPGAVDKILAFTQGKTTNIMEVPSGGTDTVRSELQDALKNFGGSAEDAEARAQQWKKYMERLVRNGTPQEKAQAAFMLKLWEDSPGTTLADKMLNSELKAAKDALGKDHPKLVEAVEKFVPVKPVEQKPMKDLPMASYEFNESTAKSIAEAMPAQSDNPGRPTGLPSEGGMNPSAATGTTPNITRISK